MFVKKNQYTGIIIWNLNEKLSIENRITKLKQAQIVTWPTYEKKVLPINEKTRYYNSLAKPEFYVSAIHMQNIFKLNTASEKHKKIDRKILGTAVNFKHHTHCK